MTIQRFDNGQRFCRVLSHNGAVDPAGAIADETSSDAVRATVGARLAGRAGRMGIPVMAAA